jgi:hypothetical protein
MIHDIIYSLHNLLTKTFPLTQIAPVSAPNNPSAGVDITASAPSEVTSYQPALGIIWSHCVTTRLSLYPTMNTHSSADTTAMTGAASGQADRVFGSRVSITDTMLPQVRCICVSKHPAVSSQSIHNYVIQDCGLVDITVSEDL